MDRLLPNLVVLGYALAFCSCSSMGRRSLPYFAPEVRLSQLSETTVQFDRSKHAGINLIIVNDLNTDVFLKQGSPDRFVKEAINVEQPIRLPDMDDRYRQFDRKLEGTGVIMHPLQYAEQFMFIWSAHKGFYHIYGFETSDGMSYLPITYYHCTDRGFYTKSIRIVEANKTVQRTGASRFARSGRRTSSTAGSRH